MVNNVQSHWPKRHPSSWSCHLNGCGCLLQPVRLPHWRPAWPCQSGSRGPDVAWAQFCRVGAVKLAQSWTVKSRVSGWQQLQEYSHNHLMTWWTSCPGSLCNTLSIVVFLKYSLVSFESATNAGLQNLLIFQFCCFCCLNGDVRKRLITNPPSQIS